MKPNKYHLLLIVSLITGLFVLCFSKTGLADSNFDTNTKILTIPIVNTSQGESYRDVRLVLDLEKGSVTLLNAVPVQPTPNTEFNSSDFCVDDYPQDACTLLGETQVSSQFVLASSCNRSFPQQIYLPDASNLCGSLGSCGACGFTLNRRVKKGAKALGSGENTKQEVENIVIESYFQLLSGNN